MNEFLRDYIKRNLINGYKDGTFSESKVMQLAINYFEKGYITEEDIEYIDGEIQRIKAEREAAENEVVEEESEG